MLLLLYVYNRSMNISTSWSTATTFLKTAPPKRLGMGMGVSRRVRFRSIPPGRLKALDPAVEWLPWPQIDDGRRGLLHGTVIKYQPMILERHNEHDGSRKCRNSCCSRNRDQQQKITEKQEKADVGQYKGVNGRFRRPTGQNLCMLETGDVFHQKRGRKFRRSNR